MAGILYDTHKNAAGGRDQAFVESMVGGAKSVAALTAMVMAARSDAAVFYLRHGCKSSTSDRFFRNFNAFVVEGVQ